MASDGKPRLTLLRVVELNLGFFGLQFSFGLVVGNTSPIFRTLGATEGLLPLLWLAGPVTGMLVQPVVGALSDRTTSRFGRRTPYIFLGALLATSSLFALPLAPYLWLAVGLLWVLDTANNMILEPYRACIVDRLPRDQLPGGFLVQSAFTGLAQTLAHTLPWLIALILGHHLAEGNGVPLSVRAAFALGAVVTLSSILYSLARMPEAPLTPDQRETIRKARAANHNILVEIFHALRDMPAPMRRLALPMLCQWYAMFAFWQYFLDVLARNLFGTSDPTTPAYRDAILTSLKLGTLYNAIAFLAAILMIPLARRWPLRRIHASCLAVCGLAMILIPRTNSLPTLAWLKVGIGIGWAALMGNNHALLAACLPPHKTGIYMGIFNLFVVLPMFLESMTLPLLYPLLLGTNPSQVLVLGGFMMILAALTILPANIPAETLFLRKNRRQ